MLEYQCDRRSLRNLTRAVPLIIGVITAIFLLLPLHLYLTSAVPSVLFSRTMAVMSAVIAACGVLCRYRSRFAAALVVLGGLVLAFLWLLNRIIA